MNINVLWLLNILDGIKVRILVPIARINSIPVFKKCVTNLGVHAHECILKRKLLQERYRLL